MHKIVIDEMDQHWIFMVEVVFARTNTMNFEDGVDDEMGLKLMRNLTTRQRYAALSSSLL